MTDQRKLSVTYGSFSCLIEGFDDPMPVLENVVGQFRKISWRHPGFAGGPSGVARAEVNQLVAEQIEQRLGDVGVAVTAGEEGLQVRAGDRLLTDREIDEMEIPSLFAEEDGEEAAEAPLIADEQVVDMEPVDEAAAPAEPEEASEEQALAEEPATWIGEDATEEAAEAETSAEVENAEEEREEEPALLFASAKAPELAGALPDLFSGNAAAGFADSFNLPAGRLSPRFAAERTAEPQSPTLRLVPTEVPQGPERKALAELLRIESTERRDEAPAAEAEDEAVAEAEDEAVEPAAPLEAREPEGPAAALRKEPEAVAEKAPPAHRPKPILLTTAERADLPDVALKEELAAGEEEDERHARLGLLQRMLSAARRGDRPAEQNEPEPAPEPLRAEETRAEVEAFAEAEAEAAAPAPQAEEPQSEAAPAPAPRSRKLRIIRRGEAPPEDLAPETTETPAPNDAEAAMREMAGGEDMSVSEFVERMGAASLPELLEASAAYTTLVRGKQRFSRRDVMRALSELPTGEEFTQEARIKGFGKLLRTGSLLRVDDGLFAMSHATRYGYETQLDAS